MDTLTAFGPPTTGDVVGEARADSRAQANVWTEYMKTPEHIEYMILPRMVALSEVVWSPEVKDYERFVERLAWHELLDGLGVSYRPLDR